jgi:hypothetical protein
MLITSLAAIGILYLAAGTWSLIFYIKDFVFEETKENGFDYQMIVVMLIALFAWPAYWFMRSLLKNSL